MTPTSVTCLTGVGVCVFSQIVSFGRIFSLNLVELGVPRA